MSTAKDKIFVCYRRDQIGWTRSIYERLERDFGSEHLCMDVEAMVPGRDFEEQIFESLRQCFAIVVVIGPDWMTVPEGSEQPRLFDRHDYVHLEIFSALAQDITIFPVLVDGAQMPSQAALPANLRSFARKHARAIPSDDLFDHAMERLSDSLRQARDEHQEETHRASVISKPLWAASTVAISIAVGVAVYAFTKPSPDTATFEKLRLAQEKLATAEVEIDKQQAHIAGLDKELAAWREESASLSQAVATLEQDKANLFEEKAAAEKAVSELKADLERAAQRIAELKEQPVAQRQSAKRGDVVYRSERGQRVHLGDENIDGWSRVIGPCLEFSSRVSGYVERLYVSYEPYGVENATLIVDNKRYRLHRAERSNEWSGSISKFFDIRTKLSPQSKLAICSNRIEDGDFDDFMLRNVELIVAQ